MITLELKFMKLLEILNYNDSCTRRTDMGVSWIYII